MYTILLKPLVHRGQECIGIYCANYPSLNKILFKVVGAKFSKTHKCWYTLLNKESHTKLVKALKGNAVIQQGDLYRYLTEKRAKLNQSVTSQAIVNKSITVINAISTNTKNSTPAWANSNQVKAEFKKPNQIHTINSHILPKMQEHLVLKAYSSSTIKTYLNEVSQLLQKLGNIPADELNTAHLKRYFVYCFERLKLSENTLHSRINAIKFYYEQVLGREKLFWEIPRPKKHLILPKLLNEEELRRLFNALTNKKHKAMLFTAYSAGLRVSEIVKIKIADIDSKRMQIFIEKAKGKKDRYVNLSPILLDILRFYMQNYKPCPKVYLFESEQTGTAYPIRTVQQIFSNAKNKAGILKDVGIHSLRHSFATHLLEKGTDIKYIKDILGHFDIKTTERYLHVSRRQLVNIISPFDDLFKKNEIDW